MFEKYDVNLIHYTEKENHIQKEKKKITEFGTGLKVPRLPKTMPENRVQAGKKPMEN